MRPSKIQTGIFFTTCPCTSVHLLSQPETVCQAGSKGSNLMESAHGFGLITLPSVHDPMNERTRMQAGADCNELIASAFDLSHRG